MPDDKKERKVPLGKPLPLTDADLDRLSIVTPEDIERAKAMVRRVSPKLAAILDAEPVEVEPEPTKKKRKKGK